MQYPDSVRFLYALGNELKTAKFGLERIELLLRALGEPQRRPARFVHVAGTNGKGSTCAMIESGLRAAGLRTGLFTSPHLVEPTERIRVDGEPVSTDDFTGAFETVHALAERLMASGEIDLHPSYFETVTAMGFLLFREKQVDIAVVEVGLGGRLDATNVVEPELCVITPVDFDHEKFLGNNLASIAAEKAGILKAGMPVVLARQRPEADEVIRRRATELGCEVVDVPSAPATADRRGSHIVLGELQFDCPLPGRHQIGNAVTAALALQRSGIGNDATARGIGATRWPGRLQRLQEHPEIMVDGAHNPAGARALAAYVAEFYRQDKPVLIFGAMRDKAVEEMAGILFPHFEQVIVTAPDQPRALSPHTFLEMVDHPCIRVAPNLRAAIEMAAQTGRAILVSGSLFLVGEASARI